MEPLATYVESHLQVRRLFELYPDRVVIHAKWLFGRQYETRVLLGGLSPEPQQLLIRYKWFKHAILGCAIGIGLTVLSSRVGESSRTPILLAASVIVALSMTIALSTVRRVLFVRFTSPDGRPRLDIARTGRNVPAFDAFIRQLQKQIRKSR